MANHSYVAMHHMKRQSFVEQLNVQSINLLGFIASQHKWLYDGTDDAVGLNLGLRIGGDDHRIAPSLL